MCRPRGPWPSLQNGKTKKEGLPKAEHFRMNVYITVCQTSVQDHQLVVVWTLHDPNTFGLMTCANE